MVHHDHTQNFIFSIHQNKAENQNLYDSEVLISDFPGFRTSAASMTSSSLQPQWPQQPLKPYFIKKLPDPDDWIIPGTKITNAGPFLWNGSSKIQFFTDFSTFSVGGC